MDPIKFDGPEKLTISPEQMRSLGYQVIDRLVDHYETLGDQQVINIGAPADLENLLGQPFSEGPQHPEFVLDQACEVVFKYMMHTTHPRFLAFVPSPSNFISVLAEALVAGYNPFAGTWMEASGPAQVELATLEWLVQQFGMPKGAGGLFTSGGSMANLTGLAVARQVCLGDDFSDAVIYASDQTHASLARGVRLLGFSSHQYRILPSDGTYRLPMKALRNAVAEDGAAGRQPFCIIANAGTTNTGAVDPLVELVEFSHKHRLWLHVDGAYGGAGILTESGKRSLEGLGDVDSLVVDPHKWLFQPYEIGCLLVKDRKQLLETFQYFPEYLQDVEGTATQINFSDYGLQLTRAFRALKLWMSLKVFGVAAFRQAVQRGFTLAKYAQQRIEAEDKLAVYSPAQMGVLTFQFRLFPGSELDKNEFTRKLVDAIIADRFTMISSTRLKGNTVLRLCTINPRTTEADLEAALNRVVFLGEQLEAEY